MDINKTTILVIVLVIVSLVLLYYAWAQEPPFATIFGEKTEKMSKNRYRRRY